MAKQKLTDAEAKAILRGWPTRTKSLWHTFSDSEYWLQALPKPAPDATASPWLHLPGSNLFSTQPDGLWIYMKHPDYISAIAVEVCGTAPNLNDKRSRYFPTGCALLVTCPLPWLLATIPVQGGGQSPRWRACGTIAAAPTESVKLPVRHLRVLYALPNDLYKEWIPNSVPAAYEYFCQHSSLDSYNGRPMQKFLRAMSPAAHFLTPP